MPLAREKLMDIHVVPGPGGMQVRAVGSRLAHVIVNLVLNAIQQIEYQEAQLRRARTVARRDVTLGTARLIAIEAGSVPDELGDIVYLKISDSGPGIHWRDQTRIFESGFSARKGGAGLGLFISRNIVEMMGGTLTLNESIMFVGSAFLVVLPAYGGRRRP
jgi:signal transduction histidine kinase